MKDCNPKYTPSNSNINKICCEPSEVTDEKLYTEIVVSLIYAVTTIRFTNFVEKSQLCETEYMSMSAATQEGKYQKTLMKDMPNIEIDTFTLYWDNQKEKIIDRTLNRIFYC